MEILERRPNIGVVFTDVEMPGSMDGFALARTVAARWPTIRVVVTSGRSYATEGEISSSISCLRKPHVQRDLIGAIRRFP